MATKKKLLQAAAGTAAASGGAGGLNVEDVFSTYLYDGTGSAQTITNGIDLDGEGGLVWIKNRENQYQDHSLFDTTRSPSYVLYTNTTSASALSASRFSSFNSDGFTVGADTSTNESGKGIASWTFRKAPKFFDVVTYTGDGTGTQNISHNLGSTPGCIIVKRTDTTEDWWVYHRGVNVTNDQLQLNSTAAAGVGSFRFGVSGSSFDINSSTFTVGGGSFGALDLNQSNGTYVAYLFAHNDGDGEFGPDGDADIIKCGSYTGTGSSNFIDLGFEPQWVLVKKTSGTAAWELSDNMRGLVGGYLTMLEPNSSSAEVNAAAAEAFAPNPTGMTIDGGGSSTNQSGQTYIYIAIRRGPMAVPTDADDVFAIDNGIGSTASPAFDSTFPVDFVIQKDQSGSASFVGSRLIGANYLQASSTSAQTDDTGWVYDYMDGYYSGNRETDDYSWMWKRAPSYFDVVAYTGTGSTMTINHNLGVTPEMIWTKRRDSTGSWLVYHSATGLNNYLLLNSTAAVASAGNYYAVSDTTFGAPFVNSGGTFISYLFASLDGVSKVGSYVGDNVNGRVIDCGFTNGARFVLIKKAIGGTGNWQVFDTERGIVTGNDPRLELDSTSAELTGFDFIDPSGSGFALTNRDDTNETGHTYIFYAVSA